MRNRRVLILILMSAFFYGIGENIATLMPAWYAVNIPLPFVGLAFTATYLLSASGFFLADIISARFGNLVVLFLTTAYPIIGIVLATFLVGPLAVLCAVSTAFFSGVRWPILDFLLQQQVTTQQRATISSFQGVLQRALYALVALLLGVLATQMGIVPGIRWAAMLLIVNIIGVLLLTPH